MAHFMRDWVGLRGVKFIDQILSTKFTAIVTQLIITYTCK